MKNKKRDMRNPFPLSFKEEVGNSISHGAMWIILLGALPFFAVRSYILGGTLYSVGISIYMICMILMYMGSTLYHSAAYDTTHKYIFRKLDHIMILLAIAGTYTPICLVAIPAPLGIILLVLEWLIAIGGIILKSVSSNSFPRLSMVIYLLMGWMALFMLPSLIQNTSLAFLLLIVLGGLFYTIGVFFYAHPEKNFFHFIWHIFIIVASFMHFIAIAFFLI